MSDPQDTTVTVEDDVPVPQSPTGGAYQRVRAGCWLVGGTPDLTSHFARAFVELGYKTLQSRWPFDLWLSRLPPT